MQYYEVNNFRIRSSNSQQLEEEKEQVHRSSVDLRKKGEGVKKKFCNCHSLICDAHGEQIASINPTTFSSLESTRGSTIASCFPILCSASLSSRIENDFFFFFPQANS